MRLSRFVAPALALLLFLAPSTTPAGAQEDHRPLVLSGGMLLDGYEAPPIHDAAVVVQGDRIVAAGPRAEVEIPEGARIVDTSGKTMLPGLVDLHIHLDMVGHGRYVEWFRWVEEHSDWETVYETAGRQLLMAGVTAAVDLGAPLSILRARARFDAQEVPGPRLHVSGPWITRVTMGGVPLDIQNVVERPGDAARETEELMDAGVDVIKLWDGLTEADMRAAVEVARPRGVSVHRHLYEPDDIRAALRAGVDVLQHVGSAGEPPYDEALVEEIAQRGVPVVLTMAHRIWVWPATLDFPTRIRDPRLREALPEAMWQEVQRSLEDPRRLGYFHDTPDQIRNARAGAARQFIEANAYMGVGTDSGTPLNFHTEAMWREMAALAESGMAPLRVISAATKNGAEIMGLADEIGTVEPGKLADVIVVDGNPLADMETLGRVETVVKGGVVWKRDGRPVER